MADVGTDWPLVGRRDEMARLRSALAGRSGGGVVLAGPAGAGKTSLARWCTQEAVPPSYARAYVVGTTMTATVPLGAFLPLLPDLEAIGAADSLFQAARCALRRAPDRSPLLLTVDDAHLLDDLSAMLVHQLATSGDTVVVLTMRSGGAAPEPLVELWKEAVVERLELPPLTAADVEELLVRVLDGPVDMALGHQLWQASAGNPLFLRELVTAAREQSLLRQRDDAWCLVGEVPSSARLVELVESRLAGLDRAARDALDLLAVGEPLGLSHIESLVPFDVLHRLETDGLLRIGPGESDDIVRLAHPVYGDVLRASLPKVRSRHLRLALAESLEGVAPLAEDDLERVVRWRMEVIGSPRVGDGGAGLTADQLRLVAERALGRFDVDFARRCAAEAYRLEPTAAGGLVLGRCLVLAKDYDAAEDVLAAVDPAAVGDDEIVAVVRARSDNLFHWLDRPDQARAVLTDAELRVAGDATRRLLAVQRAWFDLLDGAPLAALAEVEGSLTHADPAVRSAAGRVATRACLATGRFRRAEELAEQVTAAERLTQSHRSDNAGPRNQTGPRNQAADLPFRATAELFALIQSGQLDRAVEVARSAHAEAIASGAAAARAWFADMLGDAVLLQGRVGTAERWFREAVAAMTLFGAVPRARVAKAGLAHALALQGDAAGARGVLAELEAVRGRRWQLLESETVRARAWAEAAEGDLAAARATLCRAADDQERGGDYVFEAALLHDAVRLGAPTAAMVGRLTALPGLVEGELMTARAQHARALLDRDADGLAAAATAFERLGAMLLAAEAAAAAAEVVRSRGAGREATATARRAADLAGRCEGARTPGLQLPDTASPAGLSERELEIATLAAQGLPSKAIAERLFLSARTVDNYLGKVFTKLGVTSRAQLAEILAAGGGGRA